MRAVGNGEARRAVGVDVPGGTPKHPAYGLRGEIGRANRAGQEALQGSGDGSTKTVLRNATKVKPAGNWVPSISEDRRNYTPQAGFQSFDGMPPLLGGGLADGVLVSEKADLVDGLVLLDGVQPVHSDVRHADQFSCPCVATQQMLRHRLVKIACG